VCSSEPAVTSTRNLRHFKWSGDGSKARKDVGWGTGLI
jgi:hypothetical protein